MIKLKNNITEEDLIELVLSDFRKAMYRQKRNAEIMSKKTFNYGDVVVKKNIKRLDNTFGISKDDIGIIVGSYELEGIKDSEVLGNCFDPNRNSKTMYRVYYNDCNPYVGEYEGDIELYSGAIPEKLKNVTWNDIYYIGF